MNIFNGLEKIVETNHSLADCSWYGIGGKADYFVTPTDVEQLQRVTKICKENDVPIHVLGLGSNLLIADGRIEGAVVRLTGEKFSTIEYDGEKVKAWASVKLSDLVFGCVEKGLAGAESLAGVPGSIGGAVRMNAGGKFGDIGSIVDEVTVMDSDGKVFDIKKPQLVFDYRKSNIVAKYILSATMKLFAGEPEAILKNVKEIWAFKKNSQPLNTKNSGCIFKNPTGNAMSAGAMIDRAGCKGMAVGKATVSEKHANFIIAAGECKSSDLLQLIEQVKQKVLARFDVELELEIKIWP